jgi:hypothetical protein
MLPSKRINVVIALLTFFVLLSLPRIGMAHSLKKGLGLTTRNDPIPWSKILVKLHVHWVYTWGSQRPATTPRHTDFVPMIWGYYPRSLPVAITQITHDAHMGLIHYMLGFNEPDGPHQSKIKVETALKAWPALEAAGIPLGSPACANADDSWMRTFMRVANKRGYRVNFICLHCYGGPNAKGFLNTLKRIHRLYHRPLWITEFAVADWHATKKRPNIYSPQVIAKFMRAVLPAMNRMPYVLRYAWFSGPQSKTTKVGTSALFTKTGALTALGRIYAAD